jgi:hypothetical protein
MRTPQADPKARIARGCSLAVMLPMGTRSKNQGKGGGIPPPQPQPEGNPRGELQSSNDGGNRQTVRFQHQGGLFEPVRAPPMAGCRAARRCMYEVVHFAGLFTHGGYVAPPWQSSGRLPEPLNPALSTLQGHNVGARWRAANKWQRQAALQEITQYYRGCISGCTCQAH